MAKFPNRGAYGNNSAIAFSNLKEHFDYNGWRISRTREVENEAEFGKDWSLSLSNPAGDVLSQECTVQSKVISSTAKLKKDYVCDDMETSTINYLRGLPELVLLHFYDAKSKQGYVRWLDEWLASADCPTDWVKQKKVRVKISRGSVLNSDRVAEVTKRLRKDGQERELERLVKSIAKTHGGAYQVGQVYLESDKPAIMLDAKSDGYAPIIHLPQQEQWELFKKIAISGEPQKLTTGFRISNLPPQLEPYARNMAEVSVYLREELQTPEFHLKIEFLDSNGAVVFKNALVPFKRIKTGNPALVYGVTVEGYRYVFEVTDSTGTLHIGLDKSHYDPDSLEGIVAFHDLILKLNTAVHNRLTFIERDIVVDMPFNKEMPDVETIKTTIRLARALISIRDHAGVSINMPDHCTAKDIILAEMLAEIVTTGKTQGVPNFQLSEGSELLIDVPESILERFSESVAEENCVTLTDPNFTTELFDHTISLGKTRIHHFDFKIKDTIPLDQRTDQGENLVRIVGIFAPDKVITEFENFTHSSSRLSS